MMRLRPDEAVDPVALFELRAQVRVLGFQPPLLERGSRTCSSASNWNGLVMKSAAPCLIASTASFTVP